MDKITCNYLRGNFMEIEESYLFELSMTTKKHLLYANLIDDNEIINLTVCHEFFTGEFTFCHFIIKCKNSKKKYFLKTVKPGDNLIFCNDFLKKFYLNGKYTYPVILIQPFNFKNKLFYVTTYAEGKDLDEISKDLTPLEWKNISLKLIDKLDELSSITADRYSDCQKFVDVGCAEILKNKYVKRLAHPLIAEIPKIQRDLVYKRCCNILDNSKFSKPTFLHMDIKPANIIYNRSTDELTIIDFEFSRFGDEDYGKMQLLLTGINAFSDYYKSYVYPHITKSLPTFSEAENIPKLACYLFYQTMCNRIYYFDHNMQCPDGMTELFYKLLNKLSSEENL